MMRSRPVQHRTSRCSLNVTRRCLENCAHCSIECNTFRTQARGHYVSASKRHFYLFTGVIITCYKPLERASQGPALIALFPTFASIFRNFSAPVKRTGVERRGYSGLRYQYWASYWHRTISVGLLRDIAKSALRIRDQLVNHQPIASSGPWTCLV